ncbi:MAG: ATP-binding protein [Fusobacteriaceae bacterium]
MYKRDLTMANLSRYNGGIFDKSEIGASESVLGHLTQEQGMTIEVALQRLAPNVRAIERETKLAMNACGALAIGTGLIGLITAASPAGLIAGALPLISAAWAAYEAKVSHDEVPRREAEYTMLAVSPALTKRLYAVAKGDRLDPAIIVAVYDQVVDAVEQALEDGHQVTEPMINALLKRLLESAAQQDISIAVPIAKSNVMAIEPEESEDFGYSDLKSLPHAVDSAFVAPVSTASDDCIKAIVGDSFSPQWVVGPPQAGKTTASGSIALALKDANLEVWFLNLNHTEVSPVEHLSSRSVTCDIDSDSVEVQRAAIMEALAMLKELRSAEDVVLIIDEFTTLLQSQSPLLVTLKAALGETVERTRSSGPKRFQGILAIGTPFDPKELSKDVQPTAKMFTILPLLCSETQTSRGKGYPSEADVLATAALSGIPVDSIDSTDVRILGVRGKYHGISHLNTFAPRVKPVKTVAIKATAVPATAVAIGQSTAPAAKPSFVSSPAAKPTFAFGDGKARSEQSSDDGGDAWDDF